MQQQKSIYKEPWFYVVIACVLISLLVGGWLIYRAMNKPAEVQGTSQTIAETPTGVKIAADKAGYNINNGQAKEIATAIREIRTESKEPVYVINTTGKEAKAQAEQAKKDNKADFAIITDKNNPDRQVDLAKLEKEKTVELNQYNIQCYKKYLRQVEVGRSNDGYNEVGFSISKKITNDGQYIGLGIADEWKDSDNRIWVKVVYTW